MFTVRYGLGLYIKRSALRFKGLTYHVETYWVLRFACTRWKDILKRQSKYTNVNEDVKNRIKHSFQNCAFRWFMLHTWLECVFSQYHSVRHVAKWAYVSWLLLQCTIFIVFVTYTSRGNLVPCTVHNNYHICQIRPLFESRLSLN